MHVPSQLQANVEGHCDLDSEPASIHPSSMIDPSLIHQSLFCLLIHPVSHTCYSYSLVLIIDD